MTKTEIQKLFDDYKELLKETIGIEKFQFMFPIAHSDLEFIYKEAIINIYNEINNLEMNEDVLQSFKLFVDYLEDEKIKNYNSPERYGKKSSSFYLDAHKRLNPILLKEEAKINLSPTIDKNAKTVRLPVVNEYNKPVIKQKQVLLLMKLIKDEKLIINDIEDKALAEYFGKLTGFSAEGLRKGFGELKKNDIEYLAEEISQLKESLINMSKQLDKIQVK